jgi:hypothetical protein
MTFKLKIKKAESFKLQSIQWNYLQAFPISWDYPFKLTLPQPSPLCKGCGPIELAVSAATLVRKSASEEVK